MAEAGAFVSHCQIRIVQGVVFPAKQDRPTDSKAQASDAVACNALECNAGC